MSPASKRQLQQALLVYMLSELWISRRFVDISTVVTVTSDSGNSGLNACVALVYPEYNRRYLVCMAQQEAYFFNLEDFFEPHHPGNISSLPFTDPLRSTVDIIYIDEVIFIDIQLVTLQMDTVHILCCFCLGCALLLLPYLQISVRTNYTENPTCKERHWRLFIGEIQSYQGKITRRKKHLEKREMLFHSPSIWLFGS